jgi:3-hydroxyisobutyrate dehydrogenase-like beta-hydroxyacid dehydrogenase
MRIGVLGSGLVGQTIGSKLISLGHEVMMGSRDAANPTAITWAKKEGQRASFGTFANSAAFAELIFNCTLGSASLAALGHAGGNLEGRSWRHPTTRLLAGDLTLTVSNTDSLGHFPGSRWSKA